MSEGGAVSSNGVWKWVAAIVVAIMLAGAPGVVQALKAPSQEEVDFIRERQVQVLIRLAAIDQQIAANQALLLELQSELRSHEQTSPP